MSKESRVLSGRYELGSRLGKGGMATVFRGTDRLLGRTVAVKVLAPQFADDRKFVERFRREAQAAAGLNHPNVVSVFDTGSVDGVHYIVMEFVEGTTLADIIREEGALPPRRAAEIAMAVCRALSSAHEKGMVHRDVKPGNVLITPDGGVKVADFGIARVAAGEPLTVTGSVMGTASYLSPEQAKGEKVDARSDIYSLGCVLYEMLTGRAPFEADSPVSIAFKHVEEQPTAPSTVNHAVPRELGAVVMKALAKDPADRQHSAEDMASDLRQAAVTDGEATEAIPSDDRTAVLPISPGGPASTAPLPAPVIREEWRRFWPFAAAAAGLAILGIVLALTLGGENSAPTQGQTSPPAAPPATTPPTTTPPPEPPVPSVDEAAQSLALAVTAAVSGGLESDDAEDLLGRASDAVGKYREGKLEEAVGKLFELETKVGELITEEKISEEAAGPILQASEALRGAMQAAPPPTSPSPTPTEAQGGDGDGDD
jgi:eukaryotic-like serine/threonine-protein kinase